MIRCRALICSDRSRAEEAASLAARLGLALDEGSFAETHFVLELTTDRLQLCGPAGQDPVAVDFSRPSLRTRGRKDLLVRAIEGRSAKPRLVWDCTAGFGSDAFVVAQAGHRVLLIEQHPDVAALVEDGVRRAAQSAATATTAGRMRVICADANTVLADAAEDDARPDVVYLDPLFPDSGKDALPKKAMQWLRMIGTGEGTEARLFAAAMTVAKEKVVVKRPAGGPGIVDRTATYSIRSRLLRFDVYVKSTKDGRGGSIGDEMRADDEMV